MPLLSRHVQGRPQIMIYRNIVNTIIWQLLGHVLFDDEYSSFEEDRIFMLYDGKGCEVTHFRRIFYSRISALILSLVIILPLILASTPIHHPPGGD